MFRTMRLRDNNIIPQVGIRYEISSLDYSNYYWSAKNRESGGHVLYGAAGMQFFYRSIGGQVRLSVTVSQNYAGGKINSKYKVETGLYFLF